MLSSPSCSTRLCCLPLHWLRPPRDEAAIIMACEDNSTQALLSHASPAGRLHWDLAGRQSPQRFLRQPYRPLVTPGQLPLWGCGSVLPAGQKLLQSGPGLAGPQQNPPAAPQGVLPARAAEVETSACVQRPSQPGHGGWPVFSADAHCAQHSWLGRRVCDGISLWILTAL